MAKNHILGIQYSNTWCPAPRLQYNEMWRINSNQPMQICVVFIEGRKLLWFSLVLISDGREIFTQNENNSNISHYSLHNSCTNAKPSELRIFLEHCCFDMYKWQRVQRAIIEYKPEPGLHLRGTTFSNT